MVVPAIGGSDPGFTQGPAGNTLTVETIFEVLRRDHDRQRELVDAMVDTVGDSEDRARLFEELKTELDAHAIWEERHFYVPLMQADLTQEKARHSVAEHKELGDYVEQLDDYDRTAPAWLQTARVLRERLHHHLEEEEHEVFQLAGRVLSDGEKHDLAVRYDEGMAGSGAAAGS